MMEMKPFERTDWLGWAGAEPFKNGEQPLIGYAAVPDWPEDLEPTFRKEVTIIADLAGITVNGCDGYFQLMVHMGGLWTPEVAKAVINQFPAELTVAWFQDNDFVGGNFLDRNFND